MQKLIINADDCGRNTTVDFVIRNCLEEGLLSSTTVMANMEDVEGAIKLYRDFSSKVSFGAHLNLTEGIPITKNEIFLETGFCKENNGQMVFNGAAFRWKFIPHNLRIAIYEELSAQLSRLLDVGIIPSHIDSHQHIHFSPFIMPIFCELAENMRIQKMRRPKNLLRNSIHDVAIRGVNCLLLTHMRHLNKTDYFSSVDTYINLQKKHEGIYELMCHPGHTSPYYQDEMIHLKNYIDGPLKEEMITYNDL